MRAADCQASEGFAIYSGFGDVVSGPDGCFYFVIGNHRYYGGNAYLVKYDPARRRQTDQDWSDGKVHGDPDIGPGGEMWLLTFSGPRPKAKDLELIPYKGAHLLRYNVLTGESEDLSVPFSVDTWCYHTYDWERGVLFAVGQARGMLMIYDTRARRLLYAGFPPPEIHWYSRALLLDRDTGRIYSPDSPQDAEGNPINGPQRLVYWERTNNNFYLEKYGYSPYGVELDEKGESLCFYSNGQFTSKELGSGYGCPAIFNLRIPVSEPAE